MEKNTVLGKSNIRMIHAGQPRNGSRRVTRGRSLSQNYWEAKTCSRYAYILRERGGKRKSDGVIRIKRQHRTVHYAHTLNTLCTNSLFHKIPTDQQFSVIKMYSFLQLMKTLVACLLNVYLQCSDLLSEESNVNGLIQRSKTPSNRLFFSNLSFLGFQKITHQ